MRIVEPLPEHQSARTCAGSDTVNQKPTLEVIRAITEVSRRVAFEMENIVVIPGTGHPVTTVYRKAVPSPTPSAHREA